MFVLQKGGHPHMNTIILLLFKDSKTINSKILNNIEYNSIIENTIISEKNDKFHYNTNPYKMFNIKK